MRNVTVAAAGLLIFLVVAGAIYLQILTSARQTVNVWAVSSSVTAGASLSVRDGNVRQVQIVRGSDTWDYLIDDLGAKAVRASHAMNTGTILFKSDVLEEDRALVTLTLKTLPPLKSGDLVDVYVKTGTSNTTMIGRGLPVDSVKDTNCSIWVPASDEPYWVNLQAGDAALYVARSPGVGVAQSSQALTLTQSIQALNSSSGGFGGGAVQLPPIVASPSPSPRRSP
jgi:hypothetical protein